MNRKSLVASFGLVACLAAEGATIRDPQACNGREPLAPAYGASMRSSAYWTGGLNERRSSKRSGTARISLHHGDHGQEALFARLTKTSEGHGLDPEIRDFENDVFAIDRVRCNHVSTCSEELLDRLLFRVRVARMRFGKTNPFELGHARAPATGRTRGDESQRAGQPKRLHSKA